MEVELKIIDPRIREWGVTAYGSPGAAAIDLFACIDRPIILRPQDTAILISCGFALRLADNLCGIILPRSGAGHKQGLVLGNTVGLVDPDYTGPILVSAWNRNPDLHDRGVDNSITVLPGDRVAQMLFVRVERPTMNVVEEFAIETERGAKGFGSSDPQ